MKHLIFIAMLMITSSLYAISPSNPLKYQVERDYLFDLLNPESQDAYASMDYSTDPAKWVFICDGKTIKFQTSYHGIDKKVWEYQVSDIESFESENSSEKIYIIHIEGSPTYFFITENVPYPNKVRFKTIQREPEFGDICTIFIYDCVKVK